MNEVDALRIVVVEHLSRSNSHLTGPLSAQDVLNVQEAAGVSSAQASTIFGPLDVSAAPDAETIWSDFEKEDSRRARLVATLLSEQRSFMAASDAFVAFLLQQKPSFTEPETTALRRDVLKAAFKSQDGERAGADALQPLVAAYINVLPRCLGSYETISEKMEDKFVSGDLAVAALGSGLAEATHALSVVFQILDQSSNTFAAPDVVSQWFQFLDDSRFLSMVSETDDSIAELIPPLRSLVCAITLTVLNTDRAVNLLDQEVELEDGEDSYLRSPDILSSIHNTIMAAASLGIIAATPVMFAWSIILQRMSAGYQERAERRDLLQNQRAQDGFELENVRPSGARRNSAGSIVSIEKSPYDIFLINSQLDRDFQGVELLAQAATSRGLVYDVIMDIASCAGSNEQAAFAPTVGSEISLVMVRLLKTSFPYVGYQAEPVTALLSLLSGQRSYWDLPADVSISPEQQVAAVALKDTELLNTYIIESLNRYPYEFLPFTSYCKALSTCLCTDDRSDLLLNFLQKTPTLTIAFGADWNDYELAQEEENSNTMRLVEDLPLFAPTSTSRRRSPAEQQFVVPAGTLGRFVTDSGKIALLEFEHSTLALLGKRLEVNLTPEIYHAALGILQPEEVAESINLLATVLRATALRYEGLGTGHATEAGLSLIQEASKNLPRTKDIISVISDILDNYVQADLMSSDGAEISIMSACLRFLHAALPLAPGRIWSYMARCELLYSESRSGRLSALTGALDMLSERFELLQSSVNLFDGLVKSAMASIVQRKSGIKTTSRQQTDESTWLGTSDKIVGRVCLSIAQTSVDIFENSATWRFSPEIHRSILVRDVVTVMDDLVAFAFSMGTPETPGGLTSFLSPAAKFIVESFLIPPSSGSLRFQPLLSTLLVALQIPDTFLYPQRAKIISERLNKALGFGSTLLKAADYLDQPSTALQTHLFKVSSLMARLYAARDRFKLPCLSLLGALVENAGKGTSEPPSLLGYLGPQVSRSFIHILSRLDKHYDRPAMVSGIWKFFAVIMRNRQQWMANCLLTGKTPREALQGDGKMAKISPDSVLHIALEKLKSISSLSSEEALVILDFFTSAQNYWPWTIFAMQRHEGSFLTELRRYVHDLKSPSVVAKTDPKEAAFQARIAAYIAETFAMQLYHMRQMRHEETFAKEVVNDLDYFLRDGVQISGYNKSLHVNFAKNFKSRYAGCSLDDFKATTLVRHDLGSRYYYALDYADAMLSFDGGWIGPRQNGFRHEMETANLNLSLVDAQIVSFSASGALCVPQLTVTGPLPRLGVSASRAQCLQGGANIQPRKADASGSRQVLGLEPNKPSTRSYLCPYQPVAGQPLPVAAAARSGPWLSAKRHLATADDGSLDDHRRREPVRRGASGLLPDTAQDPLRRAARVSPLRQLRVRFPLQRQGGRPRDLRGYHPTGPQHPRPCRGPRLPHPRHPRPRIQHLHNPRGHRPDKRHPPGLPQHPRHGPVPDPNPQHHGLPRRLPRRHLPLLLGRQASRQRRPRLRRAVPPLPPRTLRPPRSRRAARLRRPPQQHHLGPARRLHAPPDGIPLQRQRRRGALLRHLGQGRAAAPPQRPRLPGRHHRARGGLRAEPVSRPDAVGGRALRGARHIAHRRREGSAAVRYAVGRVRGAFARAPDQGAGGAEGE